MYEIYVYNSLIRGFTFYDDYCDSSVKTCLDAFINCLDDAPFEMLDYRTICSIVKTPVSKNEIVIETITDSGIYEYFKVIKFC